MSGRSWWRRLLDWIPDGFVLLACVLYALLLWYGFARLAAWIVANIRGVSVEVANQSIADPRLKAVILILSLLMGLWVAVKTFFPPEDYDTGPVRKSG